MNRYGWFEYAENPREIANYLTGQKLTVLSGDIAATSSDLACQYEDSELSVPVYVSIRCDGATGAAIQLDYGRAFSAAPTYGCWRRIDDFLTDALLCWPEFVFNPVWFSLTVVGGWRSSLWQPSLKRFFSGRKSGSPEQIKDYPVAEPYLVSLGLGIPKRWHYSDARKPAPKADLIFESSAPLNTPYIGATDALRGFQGLVPFLEREDQQAYIFPALLEPHSYRGEGPMTLIWYTYVDQDVFFTFRSHPSYHLELSCCKDYGFRKLPPPREFWPTDPMGNLVRGDAPRPSTNVFSRFSYLSYRVWADGMAAIGDAWPKWISPPRKIEIDPSVELPDNYGRSGFVGAYGPTIHDGYSAGMKNSWFELRFQDA